MTTPRRPATGSPLAELKLEGVSVHFGRVHALDRVTTQVSAGEIVTLAGPNGSGKSTLMKVLLGLVRPQSGRIGVNGAWTAVDNRFKARLAYLPEAVAFADNLSGRQVLRFFAHARGVPRRRIDTVLERVGLAAAGRRAVRGYSRGMRQRLGLAVAILAEPELLVLDEPTGGLDLEGLRVLWSVLEEWRGAGRMVLMSSHDLALLERRVDRFCLLRAGRLIADDTPAALRERAALNVRVRFSLNGNPTQVDALDDALRTWGRVSEVQRTADTLSVEVAPPELLNLMDLRAAYPGSVRAVRVDEPGLDQVYERLIDVEPPPEAGA